MYIAEVVGSVVATRKCTQLVGMKLLVVKPQGTGDSARSEVAVDYVGAGVGDQVLVATGSPARMDQEGPIDCAIVGIIDQK